MTKLYAEIDIYCISNNIQVKVPSVEDGIPFHDSLFDYFTYIDICNPGVFTRHHRQSRVDDGDIHHVPGPAIRAAPYGEQTIEIEPQVRHRDE